MEIAEDKNHWVWGFTPTPNETHETSGVIAMEKSVGNFYPPTYRIGGGMYDAEIGEPSTSHWVRGFTPTPNETHETSGVIAMEKSYRKFYYAGIEWLSMSRWVRGFTIVELIIVVGITALISSILIVFSSQSRNMLLLGVEQTKVAQVILRAKTLAISAYGKAAESASFPEFCGFGVHVDSAGSYEIFQWNEATKANCKIMAASVLDQVNTSDPRYVRMGAPNVLPAAFIFDSGGGAVRDVFFVPPDPVTKVWVGPPGVKAKNGTVKISTKDGAQTITVTVTDAGQVTT